MRRYIEIGLIVIAVFIPIGLHAKIELTSSLKECDAKPGDLISLSFSIANSDSLVLALRDTMIVPEGWHFTSQEVSQFEVEPSQNAIRLNALKVPVSCPKGCYHIIYKVSTAGKPWLAKSDTIEIHVLGVTKFSMNVVNSPRMVVAGDPFCITLRLENNGNTGFTVDLIPTCERGCVVSGDIKQIFIGPGESKSVALECLTQSSVTQKTSATVRINALAKTQEGGTAQATKTVRIDIIPEIARTADSYTRLPSVLRLTSVADKQKAGYQIEFLGEGSPWEGKQLSVNLRSPDIDDIGRYTSRDLFSFRYKEKATELHFGDKGYSLSTLLEKYNYGRGIEIKHGWRKLLIHCFYLQSRWEDPPTKQAALSLGGRISEFATLRLNALSKKKGADSTQILLYSLKGDFRFPCKTSASVEIAVDPDRTSITKENLAQTFEIRGSLPGSASYSGEWIRASPKFNGYYKDAQYGIFTLAIPVSERLSSRFGFRTYDSNLNRDQSRQYGIRERDFQAGATYRLNQSTRFSIELQRLSRFDPLPRHSTDFVEAALKVSAAYVSSKIGFNSSAEFGKHNDRNHHTTREIERYSFSLQFNQNRSTMWGLSLRTGDGYYSAERNRYMDLGISNSLRLTRNTSSTVKYIYNKNLVPEKRANHNLQITMGLSFAKRHEILLKGTIASSSNHESKEPSLLIQYSLKTPIPIAKNQSVGSIEGRVMRSDTDPPQPIPRALLQVGDAYAVTDSKGIFRFQTLKPGLHDLYLDPSLIEEDLTCEKPIPIQIKVEGGKASKVELNMLRKGRIDVTLKADSLEAEEKSVAFAPTFPVSLERREKLDLSRIVIIMTSEGEAHRETIKTETNRLSKSLRPGLWKIRPVLPKELSRIYEIRPQELITTLKPGEEKQISFTLKEKRRPMMIIDSGEIRATTLQFINE